MGLSRCLAVELDLLAVGDIEGVSPEADDAILERGMEGSLLRLDVRPGEPLGEALGERGLKLGPRSMMVLGLHSHDSQKRWARQRAGVVGCRLWELK